MNENISKIRNEVFDKLMEARNVEDEDLRAFRVMNDRLHESSEDSKEQGILLSGYVSFNEYIESKYTNDLNKNNAKVA